MMTIEMQGVTKIIKRNTIIDDVSVSFSSGKVYGLKGINGSGKTMMMRLISGLIRPNKGQILINGKQLWKDLNFPESIGILSENPSFLDDYSGLENLKILAGLKKKIDENTIRETIAEAGLDPNDKKKYKKYSLGMKQRLGIAAAVMEHPEILLLDEPTNALDSTGIEQLKKIIEKEKQRGALIILTCHDFELLKEFCDEIYYIDNGKITDHSIEKKEESGQV